MKRRNFIRSSAALLSGASLYSARGAEPPEISMPSANAEGARPAPRIPELLPYNAKPDRIIALNLCTRPFRAQGPRLETERLGRKTIVHNYGHGGSGWSLSWGSAALAVEMVNATGQDEIAVIGCGAIGLTTAITAQRSGRQVTIYAKERPPYVRSSFATGVWSPESRICTLEHAAGFASRWETMARFSHRRFQTLLGLPGNPVEWRDMYIMADRPFDAEEAHGETGEPDYPTFTKDLIPDITPAPEELSALDHPFPVPYLRRNPLMMFNISQYSRFLIDTFQNAGGRIETYELKDSSDFSALDERTIVNCTGYGARALLSDESIIPVRGQTCKLIPQPELTYGIRYDDRDVFAYPRRDGVLVQAGAEGDFGNADTTVDPAESINAVNRLAEVMAGMKV